MRHNLCFVGPSISFIFCPLNFVVKSAVDFLGKLMVIHVSIDIVSPILMLQDLGDELLKYSPLNGKVFLFYFLKKLKLP